MKITSIATTIVAAVLLSGWASVLMAQNTPNPACPLGHEPGYGRTLTPEQQAAQQAVVQQMVAELRQKQANKTITAEEQAWLQQVEQRGGMCLTGTPRGPGAGRGMGACRGMGAGKGPGAGNGQGQGNRRGLRDGTGPRSADGTCPLGNAPQQRGRQ